jgi:hypothetical protein
VRGIKGEFRFLEAPGRVEVFVRAFFGHAPCVNSDSRNLAVEVLSKTARALSGGEATAEVEIRAVLATHPILPLMRGNFQDRVVWSYPCQVDYVNKAC